MKTTNYYLYNDIQWLARGVTFDILKEIWDTVNTGKNCEVISSGYFKKVLKFTYNQEYFYIKQYTIKHTMDALKSLFSTSKARREWDQSHLLLGHHLPSAEPVAIGEKRRLGMLKDCYIISKEIPNSMPVKEFLVNSQLSSADCGLLKRDALLRSLITYVRTLHDSGIFHGELHAENILIHTEDAGLFYLLDVGRVKHKRRLPLSWRVQEMSRLLYSIMDICTDKEASEMINNYAGQMAIKDKETFCKAIFSEIYRIKYRLWCSRTRKCLKNNNVFTKLMYDKHTVNMRNEMDIQTLVSWINKHAFSVKEGHNNIIKMSPKICITHIPLSNEGIGSVCIKEYKYPSALKGFLYFFYNSPARRSWFAAHGLIALNFRTPKPIALFEEKRACMLKKSFIIMEDISACLPCNKYVAEKFCEPCNKAVSGRKKAFISLLALSFRRMHESGIYHGDLKANNIMVMESQGTWDFFYLDLDRVCFNRKITPKKKIRNLSQINASLPNCITYTDRLRFYLTYTGSKGLNDEDKRVLRTVVQLSMRRKHIWNPTKRTASL